MLRRVKSSLSVLVLGLAVGWVGQSAALGASPDTAPAELTDALSQIETASDLKDLDGVMAHYSDRFSSNDGWDRAKLADSLKQFWDQYITLDYSIELVNWESTENGYLAETITHIEGVRRDAGRRLELTADVRSQQRFENGEIVSQDTLSESSQLTSGDNPPELTVLLPDQVQPGKEFEFDAIVNEPLGDRALLGGALEEGVTADDFFEPRPLALEILPAGGLFKLGEAPDQPDSRWISAVIVREDGMVVTTQRLQVAN